MYFPDFFWNAPLEDLKKGYVEKGEEYICLICGKRIEKGIIYPEEGILYEANRYMGVHIEKEHSSVFETLIQLDKKMTGLTEHQKNLMRLFYMGKSDETIKEELGIGSLATIRNHRFVLKEKERQAKIFLTLMELLKEKDKKVSSVVIPHTTAIMIDDRYDVTEREREKILKKFFPQGLDGPLSSFRMKEKNKVVVLGEIAKRFEKGRVYTEQEVNEILKGIYEDFVLIRRYLIEYGFMDRKPDGSEYWVKGSTFKNTNIDDEEKENKAKQKDSKKDEFMDRRKELKEMYKQIKPVAGVYQIRNTINQKVLVVATPNLKTMNGRMMGGHPNTAFQEDWKKYGEKAFVVELLEVLEEKDDPNFDKKSELKKLEAKWLDKLQPVGDKGYHTLNEIKRKLNR